MVAIRSRSAAALACACALALACASPLAAQAAPKEERDTHGAKQAVDPRGERARRPGRRRAARGMAEHRGLTQALQRALEQAEEIRDLARRPDAHLSQAQVMRHAERIGQALGSAGQHLAAIEAHAATMGEPQEARVRAVREAFDRTDERYRSLLAAASERVLDPQEIEDRAGRVADGVREVEAEHRKMPWAAGMQAPPPAGPGAAQDRPAAPDVETRPRTRQRVDHP